MTPTPFESSYPQQAPHPQDTIPAPASPTSPSPGVPSVGPGYGIDLNEKDLKEQALYELAVKRLKAKQDFRNHLAAYVVVNTFLVVLWALTGAGGFWPLFPICGWGIGLALHAWSVFGPSVATTEKIEREMDRMRGK